VSIDPNDNIAPIKTKGQSYVSTITKTETNESVKKEYYIDKNIVVLVVVVGYYISL
jgi:hypothetical protein